MEPAAFVSYVSFRKNLRIGQKRAIEALRDHAAILNVKFPTGYGKTYLAACVFSWLQHAGKVSRLLLIFPSDAQLEQFEKDGPRDLADANVNGCLIVVDVRYF